MSNILQPLGRRAPTDWEHIDKYPLRAAEAPALPVPVVWGINWYESFDNPIKDDNGMYWVGRNAKQLGRIRGGHAIMSPVNIRKDAASWRTFYNQGAEGACVGFASSRMMSHLNRKRYDARWLWSKAKEVDEWSDTNPGDDNGTSVRAAMDILRDVGHVMIRGKKTYDPTLLEGIARNRWATSVTQVLSVLQNKQYMDMGAIPFHNSWGRDYPNIVWMPLETWERLLKEDGEATMITDR